MRSWIFSNDGRREEGASGPLSGCVCDTMIETQASAHPAEMRCVQWAQDLSRWRLDDGSRKSFRRSGNRRKRCCELVFLPVVDPPGIRVRRLFRRRRNGCGSSGGWQTGLLPGGRRTVHGSEDRRSSKTPLRRGPFLRGIQGLVASVDGVR